MSKQKEKNYTLEFKQSSAKLAVESDQPICKTTSDLGIKETSLYNWVSKYHPDRRQKPSREKTPLEQENQELRRDNARLKQEREILKKAAAYFASEM